MSEVSPEIIKIFKTSRRIALRAAIRACRSQRIGDRDMKTGQFQDCTHNRAVADCIKTIMSELERT